MTLQKTLEFLKLGCFVKTTIKDHFNSKTTPLSKRGRLNSEIPHSEGLFYCWKRSPHMRGVISTVNDQIFLWRISMGRSMPNMGFFWRISIFPDFFGF